MSPSCTVESRAWLGLGLGTRAWATLVLPLVLPLVPPLVLPLPLEHLVEPTHVTHIVLMLGHLVRGRVRVRVRSRIRANPNPNPEPDPNPSPSPSPSPSLLGSG